MSLIKELNDTAIILDNVKKASEDILMTNEAELNNAGIEWTQPEKKAVITKTASEENPAKRLPTPKKGSSVYLTVGGAVVPGTITSDDGRNLIVSYVSNGQVVRIPPQPREKFKFLKIGKSGRELFKLEGDMTPK